MLADLCSFEVLRLKKGKKGGGCYEKSLVVNLFESGLEHEAADFNTSFAIDGREAWMARHVKGLRHVHRHPLMLLGT